ncbi:MAG: response regulator [Candidatus Firestonebacteria bacterium]|nr:response regulator [Candidatus Firestonebacteria bacterium]
MIKPKVLFIEDEEDVRNAVRFILEGEGYEFYGASNGPEGIAKITKFDIDLLLLDVMMPGIDGFEVCRAIKSEPSIDLPVIFVSAKAEATDISRGFALGADDYIIKPFEPNDLLNRVKRVLEKYHRLRKIRSGN